MRLVVGIGGNALLERGETPDAAVQGRHVQQAAVVLARLSREHALVVCHGNGPQVGLLAEESQADTSLATPYPLDLLGAQTQGMIGYWLARELRNAGLTRPVVAVVTQTIVDAADPAFTAPTKFIGATYTLEQARMMTERYGWTAAPDGAAWRRVVASPDPVSVVEEPTIRRLLDAGTVVICGGGGGVPVAQAPDGRLRGVDAVVDKDLTAARLATDLQADRLLLLTDVPGVLRDFGTQYARTMPRLSLTELAGLSLPAGSMGPKLDACRSFTGSTGRPSAIGALVQAEAVLAGRAGTTVTADIALHGMRLDEELRVAY